MKLFEKLKESKFGTFIREKVKPVAGDILEVIGEVTGVEAIDRVGEMLNEKKSESDGMRNLQQEFERYKLEWTLEMTRLDIQAELEAYKAEVADRESARTRESNFTASLGKRDWLMAVVVITGLFALVGTIATLVFVQIPAENQRLADMCFGAIMSIGASIFSYYVGSSKNSRAKDEIINNLTNGSDKSNG